MAPARPVRDIRRMEQRRGPKIRVPPPAIFLLAFLLGVWLDGALLRIRIVDHPVAIRALLIGGVIAAIAGAIVALWGVLTFRRHGTTVLPFKAAITLVQSGPYQFTRNPMYLGMALAYAGAALVLNAMWPMLLLPMALVILYSLVIRKEEEHLAEQFHQQYLDYRARVRRWL